MRGKREAPSVWGQALAYLSRREHLRPELERKLLNKGYPRADVAAALDKLENKALLSHERFIGEYIKSAERKGYGPARIRWELKHRKRLGDGETEKGIADSGVDWIVCARRCCRKKFGKEAPAGAKEYCERRNYLFRRGFSGDVIRGALSADD